MAKPSVLSSVIEHIQATYLNNDALAPDDDLLLSGRLDSLAIMGLVAHLEQTFDISIPFEDVLIENFETPKAIANYINQRGHDG